MGPSPPIFSPRPRCWLSSSSSSMLHCSSGTSTSPGEGDGGVSGKSPHTVVTGGNSRMSASDETSAAPPVAVFPWRHSSEPLPRLIPGTSDHELYGTFGKGLPKGQAGPISRLKPARKLFRYFSARMLGVSFLQYHILNRGWEDELASDFAWAFQMAVANLLAGTFRVPLEQIVDQSPDGGEGSGGVDFEQTLMFGSESDDIEALSKTGEGDDPVGAGGENDSNSERTTTPLPANDDDKESGETCREEKEREEEEDEGEDEALAMARSVLDPNLVQLYKSARDHARGSVQILLRTRPVSWEIVSWYMIPVLTRKHVAENPDLMGSFRDIFEKDDKVLKEQGGESKFMSDLSMRVGADRTKPVMTLVAQVSVGCRETFVVRDYDTGSVLQGDAEGAERDVTHLVRFEMPVVIPMKPKGGIMRPVLGDTEVGKWKITDWDDLLDGNIWF